MALEHPIKTVFEWNEPIEIEGMPVNGHTLTARIVYLATSACDAITDIQCGDKTIDESSSPIIYDFSAAKICVDGTILKEWRAITCFKLSLPMDKIPLHTCHLLLLS